MGSDNRIPCSDTTFEELKREKEAHGFTWDGYLQYLYVCVDPNADPQAFDPAETDGLERGDDRGVKQELFREDTARNVVQALEDELDVEGDADLPSLVSECFNRPGDTLNYDDVKNAVAAALREELPDEVLGL